MPIALSAILGAVIGSFLNVVAHRLPRGESLISPGSRCPGCGAPIKPYDNVPILGWILLRGRCRSCRAPISRRYPLVEALTAALAVGVVLVKHSVHDVALGLTLVVVLVPVALIDFEHRVIPNKITVPAALAALVIGALTRPSWLPDQLLAAVAAGGFLGVFALAYPRGMGMGDVKLAAVLGLFLGRAVAVAVFAGVLSASLLGVVIMARLGVRQGRRTAVPFGPFLAFGGLLALFAGPQLVHLYLHSVV
jgi:leader peptidase (prepilin peptidase)/N-methyltransferase